MTVVCRSSPDQFERTDPLSDFEITKLAIRR
jgi:hypothetical protein